MIIRQYLINVSRTRPSIAWFVIIAIAILANVANIITYDILIDGDWDAYRSQIIASVCFGLIGSAAIMLHTDLKSLVIPTVLLACTLVPSVTHAIRLTNPFLNKKPFAEIRATKSNPATWHEQWEFLAPDERSISVAPNGALHIVILPWKSASIRAKPVPPVTVHPLRMPLGVYRAGVQEEVDVTVSTARTGNYLGVIQANRTRVQVVSYGIKLTVPDERGDVGSVDIPVKTWADGEPHRWQLIATSFRLALKLDEQILWEGPQREPLSPVLIGDAQSDSEHGGTMTFEHARFTRRLALAST